MTRALIASAIGVMLTFVVCGKITAQQPLPLPIRLNVGTDQPYTAQNGRVYLPDQEWAATRAGYIGGHQVYGRFPSGGTPDKLLYENQRRNWQEYRFSGIPDDDYLVTLHFSEMAVLEEHGPAYTIFDVAIEGQTVLDDLNLFAEVGSNYVLVRRFAVRVTDGELNVAATPVFGEPSLAAIEVEARSPDTVAPAPPADPVAMDSYNAVLLDWADNPGDDVDGYHVYRAESPDGTCPYKGKRSGCYARLTDEPTYTSRYQDVVTATHVPYYYRVSAVDVYGNESELTPPRSAVALDEEDAALPFYHLELSPVSLQALHDDPWSYDEVVGNFIYEGHPYAVEVRYRGNWGRYHNKKSWKVRFLDESPFPGQEEINLRADYMDPSLMHSKLGAEVFEAAGIQAPQAEHVLLSINGEYWGVYTHAEQVDEGFLARTGHDPAASISIYKAVETEFMDFSREQPSEQAYREAFDKKTNQDLDYSDIIAFIELINNTPDETFAYELGRVFDVATYLDYYALIILTGNNDFSSHNAYLLHDLTTDRWTLVPYDLDRAFHPSDNWHELPPDTPIDRGTPESPIWNWVTNLLLTRVLDVPQFRAYYCHRLGELMDTIYSDAAMHSLIDATYAAVEQDGLRDWRKHGWENSDWFTAAPDELKAYVTQRKQFLRAEMPAYCPADQPYVTINEILADNRTVLEDPDNPGEFPAWFELYNAGLETVDLSGIYVTDDPDAPAKFQITEGVTIPAGGFVTFFADGDPGRGPLHTNFRLDERGGRIRIFSGTQKIDGHTYGAINFQQTADVSEGRYPDGGHRNGVDNWISFNVPTPGGSNRLLPPAVIGTTHDPLLPTASDTVTITAIITDDGAALTATLYYSATGSGFVALPMARLRGNLYTAQIPPQPGDSPVVYYVLAEDNEGQVTADPPDAPCAPHEYIVDYRPPPLIINEFMADNETVWGDPDEAEEFPDWIELYNPDPEAVDLGGRYLTDDLSDPTKFRIADGITIPAGGFLVFYADNDPEQGPLHTNFRLSKDGESVGLFDVDAVGNRLIDSYTFDPQSADSSEGRCPGNRDTWMSFAIPSPGEANGPCGARPAIVDVAHEPLFPSQADKVAVIAFIEAGDEGFDGAAITATLWYSTYPSGVGFVALPMMPAGDGSYPYEGKQSSVYSATIPSHPDGVQVAYYVQAEGDNGVSVTDPLRAPADARCYLVGYRPLPVLINEFMADNVTALEDPDEPGEFPDWIELYNPGPIPIDLGGKYLTDDLADPTKFRISDNLVIPAGGFVLMYADDDPEQGPLHVGFRLSRNGEHIGLFDVDATGNQPIDTHIFNSQFADVSERRYPNGGDDWFKSRTPTPGRGDVTDRYLPITFKRTMYE